MLGGAGDLGSRSMMGITGIIIWLTGIISRLTTNVLSPAGLEG